MTDDTKDDLDLDSVCDTNVDQNLDFDLQN